MNHSIFFIWVLLSLVNLKVTAQNNFDSVRICHSEAGELKEISAGEYRAEFGKGKLQSFTSKDHFIRYDEPGQFFEVKNQKNDLIKLKLSSDGLIIKTDDTSIAVNSLRSMMFGSLASEEELTILYSIGGFSFDFVFKNDRLQKVSFAVIDRYLSINITEIRSVYTWDFYIESINHVNKLLMVYGLQGPHLFCIDDDHDRIAVRLVSKKKNGVFSSVEGLRLFDNNLFAADRSYKLQYAKNGRLKNRTSNFNLSCEY